MDKPLLERLLGNVKTAIEALDRAVIAYEDDAKAVNCLFLFAIEDAQRSAITARDDIEKHLNTLSTSANA